MKRSIGLSILAIVAGCYSEEVRKKEETVTINKRPPRPMDQRKTLAVIDFEDKSGYGQGRLGRSASDVLTTFLFDSQQFDLIERSKIDAILKEHQLEHSGVTDDATAVQIGKLLNVKLMAWGAVTNFGQKPKSTSVVVYEKKTQVAECRVSVRLVEVETGRIVYMAFGSGEAESSASTTLGIGVRQGYDEKLAGEALQAAVAKFVDKLIEQCYQ